MTLICAVHYLIYAWTFNSQSSENLPRDIPTECVCGFHNIGKKYKPLFLHIDFTGNCITR
jgi:hypothetical protein